MKIKEKELLRWMFESEIIDGDCEMCGMVDVPETGEGEGCQNEQWWREKFLVHAPENPLPAGCYLYFYDCDTFYDDREVPPGHDAAVNYRLREHQNQIELCDDNVSEDEVVYNGHIYFYRLDE